MNKAQSRVAFLLLGAAFLLSGVALDSFIWPKWGPTAAALAGFVLLALFGWIGQRLGIFSTGGKDREEGNKRIGVMTWPMGAAWLVAIISWFPMAEIETAALKQPDHPTSEYSRPMHVKGVIRFVTPEQARTDEIANWTFFGGIAVFLGLVSCKVA
jgi:hypothetical protein